MFRDIMRPVLSGRKGVCRPVGERQPEVVIVEVGKEANEWLERRAVGGARWRVVQTLQRLAPTSDLESRGVSSGFSQAEVSFTHQQRLEAPWDRHDHLKTVSAVAGLVGTEFGLSILLSAIKAPSSSMKAQERVVIRTA